MSNALVEALTETRALLQALLEENERRIQAQTQVVEELALAAREAGRLHELNQGNRHEGRLNGERRAFGVAKGLVDKYFVRKSDFPIHARAALARSQSLLDELHSATETKDGT